jgi:hypothetical protein
MHHNFSNLSLNHSLTLFIIHQRSDFIIHSSLKNPRVADLDAGRFCRGYNTPLAMMGVALDRYFPGRNAMLVTKPM